VGARSTRYLVTMAVRIACLLLMVVVQPYGWYTWIFAAGAIVLPYIAVVTANVGQDSRSTRRSENPERALPATASPSVPVDDANIVRIVEQRPIESHPAPGGAESDTPSRPADDERGSSA